MNGPFLIERAMLLLPLHDELIGSFVIARLVTERRNSPRRHGVIALYSAFTAAMRMIHRVHDNTAHRWPDSHMPLAAGLANGDVLMIEIAHLADRGDALHIDQSHFPGRKLHVRIATLFSDKPRGRAGASTPSGAPAGAS